jgi:hypothetical protein
VNAALNGFFQDIHQGIAGAIAPDVRRRKDDLLVVREARGHGTHIPGGINDTLALTPQHAVCNGRPPF